MSLNFFFRFCGSIGLKNAEKHKNITKSHTLVELTQSDLKILSKEVTVQARIGKLISFIFQIWLLGFIQILWVKYVRW